METDPFGNKHEARGSADIGDKKETEPKGKDKKEKKDKKTSISPEAKKPAEPDKSKKLAEALDTIFSRQTEKEAEKNVDEKVDRGLADETLEGEIPLDKLTNDESREAAEEVIDLRAPEVVAEAAKAEPDSEEAAEVVADAVLLDEAKEQLEQAPDGTSAEEALDRAERTTEQLLDTAGQTSLPEYHTEPAEDISEPQPGPQTETAYAGLDRMQQQNERLIQNVPAAESHEQLPPLAPAAATLPELSYGAKKRNRLFGPPRRERIPEKPSVLDNFVEKRRKNIETEEKIPIRRKLKREINRIRTYVSGKETTVRQTAAERFQEHQRAVREKSIKGPDLVVEHQPAVRRVADKQPRQFSHAEIMDLSKKITVEGVSLWTIYEAKRISEPGLRRVVGEYLRGSNLKRALERELIEREMSFERDPLLRDEAGTSYQGVAAVLAATKGAATNEQLQTALDGSRSVRPDSVPSIPARAGQQNFQQLAIAAWVVFVILLAIVAVILILR